MNDTFVAIDFETANSSRASACSVGLVRVEGGVIVERVHRLIRPPSGDFTNTGIHGISYGDVRGEPAFPEVWEDVEPVLRGAEYLAAHSAPFDRSVLGACLAHYGLPESTVAFRCTVSLARETWSIFPTRLPDVCRRLGIGLKHHDALSDAEACAIIVIAARA